MSPDGCLGRAPSKDSISTSATRPSACISRLYNVILHVRPLKPIMGSHHIIFAFYSPTPYPLPSNREGRSQDVAANWSTRQAQKFCVILSSQRRMRFLSLRAKRYGDFLCSIGLRLSRAVSPQDGV